MTQTAEDAAAMDRSRIDVTSAEDCDYWSAELGVPVDLLKAAVESVGPVVADVRRKLDQEMAGEQADG